MHTILDFLAEELKTATTIQEIRLIRRMMNIAVQVDHEEAEWLQKISDRLEKLST